MACVLATNRAACHLSPLPNVCFTCYRHSSILSNLVVRNTPSSYYYSHSDWMRIGFVLITTGTGLMLIGFVLNIYLRVVKTTKNRFSVSCTSSSFHGAECIDRC